MDILYFVFFIGGVFYPRVMLVVGFLSNMIPANPLPFIADVILAFVLPRVLFIMYLVMHPHIMGEYNELLIAAHVLGTAWELIDNRINDRL
jgi:hypothetical protein